MDKVSVDYRRMKEFVSDEELKNIKGQVLSAAGLLKSKAGRWTMTGRSLTES